MKTYTISELAKQFNLSRSTLLHYDKIRLLCPHDRTFSKYRIYTNKQYLKLKQICSLRQTGLSLKNIQTILENNPTETANVLQNRLSQINDEIRNLRLQQQLIITLLNNNSLLKKTRIMNKDIWIELLKSSGFDEEDMKKWHMSFEQTTPEAHQDFLEFLGISQKEIKDIRIWSKN